MTRTPVSTKGTFSSIPKKGTSGFQKKKNSSGFVFWGSKGVLYWKVVEKFEKKFLGTWWVNLKSFDLSPGLGLPPSIQSLSRIDTQFTDCYWSEKASLHSFVFTGDTRNRDREKSSGQTHLLNLWTIEAMDRISGQPQVKLSLLPSISLKIRPQGNSY